MRNEHRPHVELAEYECVRPDDVDYFICLDAAVERQVIVEIRADSLCESFRARRKKSVYELSLRILRSKTLNNRKRLKSLTDRRRVNP
jgi:hypothetical protein